MPESRPPATRGQRTRRRPRGRLRLARHGVVAETDGWRFHGHRAAFERDRRRDAALTRAGYRTLRFTHDQVAHEPRKVAKTVAAAVANERAA